MKHRLALLTALACLLNSCLFTEPVFDKGFEKPDPSLAGVWVKAETRKDPRKAEFAVCVPMGDYLMIHHPAGPGSGDGGIYYEARQLTLHGRKLLQLRLAAMFKEGVPQPAGRAWTLLWLESKGNDAMEVRALPLAPGINPPDSATARQSLEASTDSWDARFGKPERFERLPATEKN